MAMDMIRGRAMPGPAGPGPGPAPGPPGAGGGLPPDLAAALGIGGAPPGAPGGAPTPSPVDIVQQMLDLSQTYLQAEQDQEDLLAMQKIGTELQQLLAKDQQDADKMMGGQATPRAMRKAYA